MNGVMKVKKLNSNAKVPAAATGGSAGMDLYACIDSPVIVKKGTIVSIPTGISISLNSAGFGAFIFARSGLAVKHGLTLANSVGVVDSDYRGEILVGLINLGSEDYTIEPNERIAQMVILPVCLPDIIECSELDDTVRGAGGFGSTGKT